MAKRGPKPRGVPYEDLPATLRGEIERAIDSAAEESARDLYDRFGLATRRVGWSSFRRLVSQRRRERKPVDLPPPEGDGVPTWEDLDRKMRVAIDEKIAAGDVKIYEAVGVLSRCLDNRRVQIEEEAARRAAEKFEQWRVERDIAAAQRKAVADHLAEKTLRGKGLTDDVIAAVRDIYGVALDDGRSGSDG